MKNLNRVLLAVAIVCVLWVANLVAEEPGKSLKFIANEVQQLRLQVKQKDAQLKQANLNVAQAQFQQALQDLSNEAEQVKKANNWPSTVTFDPNQLSFSEPEKKPESK